MTEIKYVIEHGEPIPEDVTGVSAFDQDAWERAGDDKWRCTTRDRFDRSGVQISSSFGPLTVTAVREHEPERNCPGCGEPPHPPLSCVEAQAVRAEQPEPVMLAKVGDVIEHGQTIPANVLRMRDAATTSPDECWVRWGTATRGFRYLRDDGTHGDSTPEAALLEWPGWWPMRVLEVDPEPQPADVSVLLDLVRQYGTLRQGGYLAPDLFDRIAALVPQQPVADPSVLSLPQPPPGAVALVSTEDGTRFERAPDPMIGWVRVGDEARRLWQVGEIMDCYGPVTVVMREPRTWPRLDTLAADIKTVRGASGKVYHLSHFAQSVPVFCEHTDEGRPTGPGIGFHALQTFDGPLTEVFEDEPGGEL